ncbi:MAG: membrane protein insertase YidC [Clostridia bacterium]|nr:membrane protein insertase YidC [Clostridia bacterium]MBQ8771952.1 membrane protein insertase YidC [Clostridia bacterium]MBQ8872888.1 membrane protein insertase YidC [Clostridia bacterium]
MKKKISSVLTVVLLLALGLTLFASCTQKKVEVFDPESGLGLVGKLVMWMYNWIGNYGWTVVVFTVFLKILMLPLDIWQRYSTRKSTLKQKKVQPLLDNIDKRYGANTQRANEEKQKLLKKQGISVASACLPMIVTMVVFFLMFAGLREFSYYKNIQTFNSLTKAYYSTMEEQVQLAGGEVLEAYQFEYDKTKASLNISDDDVRIVLAQIDGVNNLDGKGFDTQLAQWRALAKEAIQKEYKNQQDSWLWIHNISQPDTWAKVMPEFSSGENNFATYVNTEAFASAEKTYNIIRSAVMEMDDISYGKNGSWNGLMILPLMSVALSFLSMWISQRMERKTRSGEVVQNQQQAAQSKTMMIMMPLMMAWFGFMYTGSFAIYMVVNYFLSIFSTVGLRAPVEKMVERKLAQEEAASAPTKASYMR